MSRLVFLDIDGVLNGHDCDPMSMCGEIHSSKVRLLNRLLFCTGAKLVLSTAWRYLIHREEMNLAGIEWLLRSHGLHAGRLAGFTKPDTMERGRYNGVPGTWPMVNERGQQITHWRAEHRHAGPYLVIDDLDLGITEAGHPFLKTDGKRGMTEADANRAIEMLTGIAADAAGKVASECS